MRGTCTNVAKSINPSEWDDQRSSRVASGTVLAVNSAKITATMLSALW